MVQDVANLFVVWGIGKTHVDLRTTCEIHAQGNAVPKQHGKDAGHAEDQRKAEEPPLLSEKVYIGAAKKFHVINLLKLYAQSLTPLLAAKDSVKNHPRNKHR